MYTLTGAQICVQLLERQGVRVVAGIPGGANLPLYDALGRSSSIRHVLARHEQGAGFIAQGMARVSGRPAVCLASSGPAATNLLTALADACRDSIPLICITGQVPRPLQGTDAFQEVDIGGMSRPVSKAIFRVEHPLELLAVVPEAFRLAASGRPGPVLIDIPKDVQIAQARFDVWPAPGAASRPEGLDAQALAEAARLIDQARRPVLYLGGGIIHGGASGLAQGLAEKAGLPTTTTLMALGALPAGHPLYIGMLGMHGARYTNRILDECDLLIAAGARFDDRATGQVAGFCPEARIIHIDIDARELGKIKRPDVALRGDVGTALAALRAAVTARQRRQWRQRVAELKELEPLRMPGLDDARTPYGLIRAVAAHMGERALVTTDVGQHQMWVAQAYPFRGPRQWLTSGGLGTMGFGLPAAIGAALAAPDRPVVCFSGDGSLLMNIQELATAAEVRADLKIVLMNNRGLGMVSQQQALFYERRQFASSFEIEVDFCRIAQGFGIKAVDLGAEESPRAALARALNQPGPCLIHAPIASGEMVFPMVPPGMPNRRMIDGDLEAG